MLVKKVYFMDYGGLLEARVKDTVCRISPIRKKGFEIPITLIVKKGSTNREVFWKTKHFLEEYYTEPDLVKKPEVQEDDELSDGEISDEWVPVEDKEETNTVEFSERNDGNETSAVVEADERNDNDLMNATVVD